MNKELIEAINLLEKENNISKDVLLEAIENSLLTAYKNNYGRADNVKVNINRETGDFSIVAEREVVETVEDPMTQVSLAEAKLLNSKYELGDIVQFSVNSKEFGRIAVQNAKNVILQKLREAERNALYEEWHCREKDIVTGIVQRYVGRNISINLGKIDTILNESELRGEKIDIINWDDNPAFLIENALSPAKVILVAADEEAREAQVIVPDYQLSLAIGKEGQNARLAARLTGFKIDIKSETQARESGLLDELESGYEEGFEGYTDDPLISVAEEDAAETAENEAAEGTEEPAAEQE